MIITEDKDKKLPIPPSQGQNNPFVQRSVDGDLPSYEQSEAGAAPSAGRDTALDILGGSSSEYSAGPSVPPVNTNILQGGIPLNLPKQNKLRIHRDNSAIKDTFVIDANLPAPPGSPERALDLFANNGSVNAKVYLMGTDVKGRVEMAAKSKNGSVKFQIAECPRTMFINLHAESHNGSVTVLLPPKFTGPLSITAKNGSVTLFPSLRSRTRTLDESSTTRRCWVGEWPGDTEWDGDECTVVSHNGSVRVGFWEGEPLEKPAGLFKRLFG